MTTAQCPQCGAGLPYASDGSIEPCARCGAKAVKALPKAYMRGVTPLSVIWVPLVALASGAAFYALGPWLLLRDTELFHLFCQRGWVPYVCVLLFFTAFWSLVLRLAWVRREYRAFDLDLLPEEENYVLDRHEASRILARIDRLTDSQKKMVLITRIRQALLRFNQLGTAEKLDDLLRYRAEADLAAQESSYSAAKFIIWAIPVLGFVGTVMGISSGVSAFSTLIQTASSLSSLRNSLKGVTYGLGQAFETTMLALSLSLILMMILSIAQRREDKLLADIDDYCAENLLHKANFERGGNSAAQREAELNTALGQLIRKLDTLLDALPMTRSAHGAEAKTSGSFAGSSKAVVPASPSNKPGSSTEASL